MSFATPHLAFVLGLLPLYWLLVWLRRQRRGRLLARLLSPQMQGRLISPLSSRRRLLKLVLTSAALLAIGLAALRPRIGVRLEKVEQAGIDLAVAIDTSRSMLATDLAPNRLLVAKREIRRLIERLDGDRIGLIAFAGGAVLQCPLTTDYSAAALFLDIVDENLVPVPGTAIAAAIDLAREKMFGPEQGDRVLVLLTDGEDHGGDVVRAARAAAVAGIRIYTVGIGSPGGSPIPEAEGRPGEYRKRSTGEIVLSRLEPVTLEQVAEITGGRYFHVEAGSSPLEAVLEEIGAMEGKRIEERVRTVYEEQYPLLLLAAILFLGIEAVLGVQAPRTGPWRGRFE
jgi:Ca-activated chloride channel homolog